MVRQAPRIVLSVEERQGLEKIRNAHSSPQAQAFRARIVLRCAEQDNPTNWQVAVQLECDPDTVCKWRRRFHDRRIEGLKDLPRSGAPRHFSP